MKPIYTPKGRAKEYGDYAINIYTGCPHRCYYCFAPNVLHKQKAQFHSCVEPRNNIIEKVRTQIEKEKITNKLIHLCFTCDPYPAGHDSTPTREIIKILKNTGNHVQILTKNGTDAMRDFDLLDENDWYGITYAGYDDYCISPEYVPEEEPYSGSLDDRIYSLMHAHQLGIKTWVSAEPVLKEERVLNFIDRANYVDLWKIGKLNYYPSNINWTAFGRNVEAKLQSKHKNYYIKESLRTEMKQRY